jgi:hypothetical protein
VGELYFGAAFEAGRGRFDISQPINFCIYCGELDRAKLTDEHVAPEGLQGDIILRKASCIECAKKTGYSEMRTLRGPLAVAREHYHLYGERNKDKRPQTLPLDILRKDWTPERIHLPTADFPFVFRMPRFPPPRFLRPAQRGDADFHVREDFRQVDTADGISKMQAILASDPGREKPLIMEVYELSKVLAKIAYCFAICFLGPYAIKPFVTEIIIAPREHAPSFLYYVGGAFIGDDRIEQLTTSNIGTCTIRPEPHFGKTLVLARQQILAPFGGPVYEVIVGELVPPGAPQTMQVPTPKLASKTYRELRIRSGEITANPALASPGEPVDDR